jgi:hypothetical protein
LSTFHVDDWVRALVSDNRCGKPAVLGMTALIGTRVSVDAAQGPECYSNGPVPEGAYAAYPHPALSSGIPGREGRGFRQVRRGDGCPACLPGYGEKGDSVIPEDLEGAGASVAALASTAHVRSAMRNDSVYHLAKVPLSVPLWGQWLT